MQGKRIYISGPVTGRENNNLAAFYEAAAEVARQGGKPVIPHDYVMPGEGWEAAMKVCVAVMMRCDGLYAMLDWGESRGARIEVALARDIGMTIYDQAARA